MLAQTPTAPQTLTVAITGASGSIFAKHLLDALDCDERVANVNLILSDSGQMCIRDSNSLFRHLIQRRQFTQTLHRIDHALGYVIEDVYKRQVEDRQLRD